jgi:hypothetical protein
VPLRGIIVSKAIKQMFTADGLERTGHGKKGDPFRYSLLAPPVDDSPDLCPKMGIIGGRDAGHESVNSEKNLTNKGGISCPRDSEHEWDTHGHESKNG